MSEKVEVYKCIFVPAKQTASGASCTAVVVDCEFCGDALLTFESDGIFSCGECVKYYESPKDNRANGNP